MGDSEREPYPPSFRRRGAQRTPLRLSPSSIAIFRQCPQQYKFRYIDKLGEQYLQPRPYYTAANHTHATLKDLLSVPEEQRTPARAEQLLLQHWGGSRLGFRDEQDERRWREKALGQVKAFARSSYARGSPIMLEASLEAVVSPGVMLYGRVDRVDREADGNLNVMDYKTGRVPAGADWGQMELHALLLDRARSVPVAHLCLLYLDSCTAFHREVSRADLEQIRWELLGVALRIRQERRHGPRPGVWCRSCDFAAICPISTPAEAAAGPSGQMELWEEWPHDL